MYHPETSATFYFLYFVVITMVLAGCDSGENISNEDNDGDYNKSEIDFVEDDSDTDNNTLYTSNIASCSFDQEYSYAPVHHQQGL